jgi:hypothetical protein
VLIDRTPCAAQHTAAERCCGRVGSTRTPLCLCLCKHSTRVNSSDVSQRTVHRVCCTGGPAGSSKESFAEARFAQTSTSLHVTLRAGACTLELCHTLWGEEYHSAVKAYTLKRSPQKRKRNTASAGFEAGSKLSLAESWRCLSVRFSELTVGPNFQADSTWSRGCHRW